MEINNGLDAYRQQLPVQDNLTKPDNQEKVSETKDQEPTREEIMQSKEMTPEQKLEKLNITPMDLDEMASGLLEKMMKGIF